MNDPRLYDLTPRFVDYGDGSTAWVVGADLRGAFGVESNNVVGVMVAVALVERLPGLEKRVRLDSEDSCFFAYSQTKSDADDLVSLVFGLLAQRA